MVLACTQAGHALGALHLAPVELAPGAHLQLHLGVGRALLLQLVAHILAISEGLPQKGVLDP